MTEFPVLDVSVAPSAVEDAMLEPKIYFNEQYSSESPAIVTAEVKFTGDSPTEFGLGNGVGTFGPFVGQSDTTPRELYLLPKPYLSNDAVPSTPVDDCWRLTNGILIEQALWSKTLEPNETLSQQSWVYLDRHADAGDYEIEHEFDFSHRFVKTTPSEESSGPPIEEDVVNLDFSVRFRGTS